MFSTSHAHSSRNVLAVSHVSWRRTGLHSSADFAKALLMKSPSYLEVANIHAFIDHLEDVLPSARPCADRVLAACAKLSLLQLDAQRAFVCLLDQNYCYTVAEATASSKLRPLRETEDAEHELIICGTAVRHGLSLPSLIFEAAVGSHSSKKTAALSLPVIEIPDIREDDRCHSTLLAAPRFGVRYCAGVPVNSNKGVPIGVICISSRETRTALTHAAAELLRDISSTITDHLELCRSKQDSDRSNRMVRGLGSFVEDKATLSGLQDDMRHGSSTGANQTEGTLNVAQQKLLRDTGDENTVHARLHDARESSAGIVQGLTGQAHSPSSTETLAQHHSRTHVALEPDQRHDGPKVPIISDAAHTDGSLEKTPANGMPVETAPSTPHSPDDLEMLFSRAANIIRESIEVEGVLFFDASVGYWGGLLESGKRDGSKGDSSTTSTTSSSGEDTAISKQSTIRTNREEVNCKVFGFSMTEGSSIDGAKASPSHLAVPERFLRILLRRYPEGKIFNFAADGSLSSDTETPESTVVPPGKLPNAPDSTRRRRHTSYSRANEAALIINIFPGARSVIAFPLWDSHRERWFAGGVAWTRSPTRTFSVNGELSYLRAFGVVAMAEVARRDALMAKKSKDTLLGSISHELRSPLHGILGAVEILQETEIDVFQSNVVFTLETCGVMLLDTIDHLLTQSEINQSVRTARLRKREQRGRIGSWLADEQDLVNLTSALHTEIDVVAEEVVESLFAGYEYTQSARIAAETTGRNLQPLDIPRRSSVLEDVKVLLDIEALPGWTFDMEVGAFRRVLMNLFGNALKYTTNGFVKVSVTQRKLSEGRHGNSSEIKITVEDTGKGIGAEFRENHLFKPFRQEDTLSQGVGLGLSITHQIVASLGGKIDIQSTVGHGTTMSVFLQLARSTPSANTEESRGIFDAQTSRTRGLRVSFQFFTEDADTMFDAARQAEASWELLRGSLERLCGDWLNMDVLVSTELAIKPDIYIATRAGAAKLNAQNQGASVVQPVVVVCPSAAIAHQLAKAAKTDEHGVAEYISQPFGPRKMAKTLTLCLDRWADLQVNQAIQRPAVLRPSLPSQTLSETCLSPQTETPSRFFEGPDRLDSLSASAREGRLGQRASDPLTERSESYSPMVPHGLGSPSKSSVAPFLIVDDNAVNIKLLSAYLSRKSLPFTAAVDGILAVEAYKAARGDFSCIFMDVQMPRMDGLTATRAIRDFERQEQLEAVTVVALTGLATEEKQKDAEASGVNEFFAKPVRLKALDAIIERTARPLQNVDTFADARRAKEQ